MHTTLQGGHGKKPECLGGDPHSRYGPSDVQMQSTESQASEQHYNGMSTSLHVCGSVAVWRIQWNASLDVCLLLNSLRLLLLLGRH